MVAGDFLKLLVGEVEKIQAGGGAWGLSQHLYAATCTWAVNYGETNTQESSVKCLH
jgi:hypothetical protein